MTRFRCLSCGGTYDDTQPDSSSYYHTCPSGTARPRDENPDPTAPLEEFQSEHGKGHVRPYRAKHAGLGRVEVPD